MNTKDEETIQEILKILKTRGWESPEEVDAYFEASLRKALKQQKKDIIRDTIKQIAEEEGWEESEKHYLTKLLPKA